MPTVREQVEAAKSMSLFDCCCKIVEAYEVLEKAKRSTRSLSYAVPYAKAVLQRQMNSNEAKVQAAYILCNITHWRGDDAKMVRARLKQLAA